MQENQNTTVKLVPDEDGFLFEIDDDLYIIGRIIGLLILSVIFLLLMIINAVGEEKAKDVQNVQLNGKEYTTDFDKPTLRDFLDAYEKPDTPPPTPLEPDVELPDTGGQEPKVTIDNDTNTATLNSGGTISEVASKTDYTSAELLEYNGISLEEARKLPVGTEIKIPEKMTPLEGEYGTIKIYQDKEGNQVCVVPNEDGTKSIHNTFSDNPSLYVQGNLNDPNSIHFTNDNGVSETWSKDSNGNFYQSQVSTEDFSINYTSSDDGKSKVVSNIEILSDDASFDDIAPHTDYSAHDLREFNDYPQGGAITRDSIDIPKSKNLIMDGGYGVIVHLSGFNGNEMFIVPNQVIKKVA